VVRLLKLPPQIQESLRKGEIREGHARALLGIKDKQRITEVWKKVVKNNYSVRQVEQLVNQVKIRPKKEGGLIEIAYYSPEDLERLIEMFNQISY